MNRSVEIVNILRSGMNAQMEKDGSHPLDTLVYLISTRIGSH